VDAAADRSRREAQPLSGPRWRALAEGWGLLLACGLAVLLGARLSRPVALFGLLGAAGVAFAFRDPERAIVAREDVVLSPADGRVLHVARVHDDYWGAEMVEVGVFLALWNVHVQRAPLEGRIVAQRHRAGGYRPAMTATATHGNNQVATYFETAAGPCTVTQISGLLARRIVTWAAEGDRLAQGERLGMIKFGSQVTVRLPLGAEVLVKVGQQVRAGLTPLARLASSGAEAAD
jgi:phosphatidylserine decarboxylase